MPGALPCSRRAAGAPLGRLLSRDTVLWLPPSTDICQQEEVPHSGSHPGAATPQKGSEGSPSPHGHTGARRALITCAGAHGTKDVPCSNQVPATTSSYSHRAWAVLRTPRRTSGDSVGTCQGLFRKPQVLSWQGKGQKKGSAVTGTMAAVPATPQAEPSRLIPAQSHRKPSSERMQEGPSDEPDSCQ